MHSYGWNKPLYILPFDHRSSFIKNLFDFKGELGDSQIKEIKEYKKIIYEAALLASGAPIPQGEVGILVDEEYGKEIILDAKEKGIVSILTVEKSGQEEFEFEYGEDFGRHLLLLEPTFAKVLIRYNPTDDAIKNARQRSKLKKVSDFVHAHNIKLLVEPLIPATAKDLELVSSDAASYDTEVRPAHTIELIKEFQREGIEVDVWKIEGVNEKEIYKKIVEQARSGEGRENVGVIILGRNESKENVKKWITSGVDVPGIIGFAVGRTIFWDPLLKYKNKEISKEEAVTEIKNGFVEMYETLTQK